MDPVAGPPQLGAGVFRHLKHLVDPDCYAIDFRGVPLRVARCGAVTVPTPHPGPCPWCPACQPEDNL